MFGAPDSIGTSLRYGVQFGSDTEFTFGDFDRRMKAHNFGTQENAGEGYRVVIL